jgi:hypothetical protein
MKLIHDLDEDVILKTYEVYSNYDFIGRGNDQSGGAIPHVFTEYDPQYGGLIQDVFQEYGVFPNQRGEGLGSIFGGLARFFKPLFFSGLKAVGKQAVKSAGAFAGDLISGADWRESGENRLREAGGKLVDRFGKKAASMAGLGYGPDYGMSQYGGANKSVHSAVKLFSFSPPAAVRGPRAPKRKRSRASGKQRPVKRRRVQRKKSSGPVKRRRKRAGRKKKKTKRGTVKRKRPSVHRVRQAIGHGYPYPPF